MGSPALATERLLLYITAMHATGSKPRPRPNLYGILDQGTSHHGPWYNIAQAFRCARQWVPSAAIW